jgi:hypothetical protein
MNKDIYKHIYHYDNASNTYLLEMSINNFYEIFHDWDGSAIRKKDLDPDMVDYMIEAVTELPRKAKITIVFNIRQQNQNKALEDIAIIALKNYFEFRIFINNRKVQRLFKFAALYLIFGFCFILSANQLSNYLDTVTSSVFSEGLFIGGWVFVWESISLSFFKSSQVRIESKRFKRIMNSSVQYKYLTNKQTKIVNIGYSLFLNPM